MSIAGLNCRIDIYYIDFQDDDVVGGAMVTGSLQYQNVAAHLQAEPENQILAQQGLETTRTFTATIVPGYLTIRERDEFEVSAPTDHVYYGERFRITSVTYTSHNRRDPRNYLILGCNRSVRSHSRQ